MGMKKVKKWIPDTVIARKLHSVLDSNGGEILIEVEVPYSGIEEAIRSTVERMTKSYMQKMEMQLFVNPKQYSDLQGLIDKDNKIFGVDIDTNTWVDDETYLVATKDGNNGNK